MYVFVDIEWVTNKKKNICTSQLAAVSVDENWEVTGQFFTRIQPINSYFELWDHVGFTGGTAEDFMRAPTFHDALRDFDEWIFDDDVICVWGDEPLSVLLSTYHKAVGNPLPNQTRNIAQYLRRFLGEKSCNASPYGIAAEKKIEVVKPKHDSLADVLTLAKLFQGVEFPQEYLSGSHLEIPAPQKKLTTPYCYEPEVNTIHKTGCEKIFYRNFLVGHKDLTTAFKKKYRVCTCVEKEYRTFAEEKRKARIYKLGFVYVASYESRSFHRFDCRFVKGIKDPIGSVKYENMIEKGKVPCQICQPRHSDIFLSNAPDSPARRIVLDQLEKNTYNYQNPSDISSAIKNYQQSKKRRENISDNTKLSSAEKRDKYTLTNPVYSVFAARGYQTFHLPSCQKLNSLSEIKGYESCHKALSAGLTPCKYCKPKPKNDVKFSIPLTSHPRPDETVNDIIRLCEKHSIEHSAGSNVIKMNTPVGKWKILTDTFPIRLEHINIPITPDNENDYHTQHRIFFSMTDAFYYIIKHDSV